MAIGATIPAKLIQRIIPLLMKQTEQLSKFVSDFTNRIMQLNSKTRCSDPKIKQLKTDLEKILQQINTIINNLPFPPPAKMATVPTDVTERPKRA